MIAHSLSTEKLRSWKQSCLPQCSWTGSGAVWFILLLYKVSGYYPIEYKDWKTVFLRCFQAPDIVQLPSHEGMEQVFRPCRWTEVSSALLLQAQEEQAVKQQLVKNDPSGVIHGVKIIRLWWPGPAHDDFPILWIHCSLYTIIVLKASSLMCEHKAPALLQLH